MLLFAPLLAVLLILTVLVTLLSRFVDQGVLIVIARIGTAITSIAFVLSLLASPVFCILYIVNSPLRKLKRLALEERLREVKVGIVAAFSDKEYGRDR